MYAKIFSQIFDSSIAEHPDVRYGFMDLLVLADSEGVVDMTAEAIARRTNVPLARVLENIKALSEPDPNSRSDNDKGARIKLLDSHRNWGWQIVNYDHYRNLRDEEARKAYFRDQKRKQRASKLSNSVQQCPTVSPNVTHAEGEGEVLKTPLPEEGVPAGQEKKARSTAPVVEIPRALHSPEFSKAWAQWMTNRRAGNKPKCWATMFVGQLEWLERFGPVKATEILKQSMRNGWQGLFEPKETHGTNQRNSQPDRNEYLVKRPPSGRALEPRQPKPGSIEAIANKAAADYVAKQMGGHGGDAS